MIRGSCLCGGVRFEIEGRVSGIGQCHCSLCRKVSGSVGDATLLTAARSFRWTQGEELVQSWRRPSGFGSHFCRACGSPLPRLHASGKLYAVPAGALDDDPGTGVVQHIFVASKAPWDAIGGDAPQYAEGPPAERDERPGPETGGATA